MQQKSYLQKYIHEFSKRENSERFQGMLCFIHHCAQYLEQTEFQMSVPRQTESFGGMLEGWRKEQRGEERAGVWEKGASN